ncbi:HypC/HybG/HupF family hydrogenase formation chaperone [Micromonospora fulviviridis]|uniref:HypC/HybG/HupF family hydrogenase formation chaperone n=1 Tax=Micromonospora fulviviridis TaxID=47860 RepID=A0ABV2VEV6_9ACTN
MTPDAVIPPAGRPSTAMAPDCHGDVCITCSDVAVAVRIRELVAGRLAVVDTDSGPEEVSVALVDAAAGDVVLVHAKEAIAVVEKAR